MRISHGQRPWRAGLVTFVISGIILATLPAGTAAVAAEPAVWGPDGIVTTGSAVTVRWDNEGNAPENTVYRDDRQVIALTGGKTYEDVLASTRDVSNRLFGELSLKVSQTRDLVNQMLTVEVEGLPPYRARTGAPSADAPYLAIIQCWGSPLYDESGAFLGADPAATEPDPRTCQEGTGGAGQNGTSRTYNYRDPLAETGPYGAGNLELPADSRLFSPLPYLPVSGEEDDGIDGGFSVNRHFSTTTTNELTSVVAGSSGTASVTFEAQTGAESTFLGCGAREGAPSTDTCWLVAVPISEGHTRAESRYGVSGHASPLSPSMWAQRMQVKLEFAPVADTCPGGQARALIQGSELAANAMESWTPGLCADAAIGTGYTKVSDAQARRALAAGSTEFVLTTEPAASADVHAPVALTGVAVAFLIDYRPCGRNSEITEATVERCGYADEDEARAEIAKAGSLVRELNLTPRLVAKLLTQSYAPGTMPVGSLHEKAAAAFSDITLYEDPEFAVLNPRFRFQEGGISAFDLNRIEVEGLLSDAAAAVWRWIVADDDARGFLNGCPDPYGLTINPWYSTRTYEGCEADAAALETAAAAKRGATETPSTFDREAPPSYPPASNAYPQVLFVESDQISEPGNSAYVAAATLVDVFPPMADHLTAARSTARGTVQRGSWCDEYDGGCFPELWKASATFHPAEQRRIMTITDTASAARYQLPTARLCSTETDCVAASPDTLAEAASGYASTGAAQPLTVNDPRGYPLLTPVYAALDTTALTEASAGNYADVIEWLTTTGQAEGTLQGQLRPGYVPLTEEFAAQAQAAVAALRAVRDTTVPTTPTTNVPSFVPRTVVPGGSPPGTTNNPPPTTQQVAAPGGTTPATEVGFPQFGLFLGLGAAVLAGLVAPLLGRSRRVREE